MVRATRAGKEADRSQEPWVWSPSASNPPCGQDQVAPLPLYTGAERDDLCGPPSTQVRADGLHAALESPSPGKHQQGIGVGVGVGTKLCPGRSTTGLAREASSVPQYEPGHETGGGATNQKPGKCRQHQSSASTRPCDSQRVQAFPSPHGLEIKGQAGPSFSRLAGAAL